MQVLANLQQGSREWIATRLQHLTGSEAPIMMGVSPHMSRDELLDYKVTQVEEEISMYLQRIYDQGHESEAKARPNAEEIIGQELYPVVGVLDVEGLKLLASFDGLTMCHDGGFEHKQWNAAKVAQMEADLCVLPEYYWQMEHQMLVAGLDQMLFMMSDGTKDNMFAVDYVSVPERRAQLIAGWKQFEEDLKTHQVKEYKPKPEGETPDQLPALSVQLIGQVRDTNLAVYKETALQFIKSISTELSTDEDFATAEKTIKFCDKAEKELDLVKSQALSQTADIADLFNTIDTLKESMRSKRLELNKLVKARKDAIRIEIVQDRRKKLQQHIDKLNSELEGVRLPEIVADFSSAIKGKKTVKSLEEAANDELAGAKMRATMVAQEYQENIDTLNDLVTDEHRFLFNDLQQIIHKSPDDFELIVTTRIKDYTAEQEAKREAERARIRAEEEAKAQAKVAQQQKAETVAIEEEAPVKPPAPEDNRPAPKKKLTAEDEIAAYLVQHFDLRHAQGHEVAAALLAGDVPHIQPTTEAKAA